MFAQRNWPYRGMYLFFNMLMLLLVYTTPNTVLWTEDGSPNTAMITTMMLHIGVTWILYLLVQGSDPGKTQAATMSVSPAEAHQSVVCRLCGS